MNGNVATEL